MGVCVSVEISKFHILVSEPGLACAEWVCKIHDKICYLYVGKKRD